MATILLSAAGAALGSGFGGTILGLSGAVIGRAIGATAGRVIDQRLLGAGSQAVETGRIDRLRIQTTGEGVVIPKIWGQLRLPGHIIWAAPLTEVSSRQGGGKGTGPRVTNISYRLSFALALCEGPILGVGRVWADGEEISAAELNMQVYDGSEDQLPDPCIAAHEGENTPAYRGTAYVVLEELDLERWGNRLPQLSFEVTRAAASGGGLSDQVQAVAMIPGTGEYSLATTPVTYDLGWGESVAANSATTLAPTDFGASMDILGRELPGVGSVSLVVSWFGDDLRVGHCTIQPKVEDVGRDGKEMAWRAGGIGRAEAAKVAVNATDDLIYGGTPADGSVIEALRAITKSGRKAVFYPFILMEQLAGNGRPDPWTGAADQPVMPWRGRITAEIAPGRAGSPDGTAANEAAVTSFFGTVDRDDFGRDGDAITYTGPQEWSYRRFILHYAHLCALAGGVDSFLIGSEMRALTQLRGPDNRFPAVEELRRLAADVRAILGPNVKISYASDWSEYFGYHLGGGEAFFHLDPLWADPNIDFIGIDNYMPLSDWREGETHKDAGWRRIDAPGYLESNVAGGEGYDWYYADPAHRDAQIRTPITDGAHGEHWLWRYKDLANWWANRHHDRPNGTRKATPTAWVPRSKPIWFTEMGCAALDKGTNQPNKFLDAMSSESQLPFYSNGARDDVMQAAYVAAMVRYWSDPAHNPVGSYGGRMVDMSRAHVWCWDARPYPAFPGRSDLWSDGPAWDRGHWLNGRAGAAPLGAVVADICAEAGVTAIDTTGLSGVVRGYSTGAAETARASLQPLMLIHGFDAVERDGVLKFVMRDGRISASMAEPDLAEFDEVAHETTRSASAEIAGRLRLTHIAVGESYATSTVEASLPNDPSRAVSDSEVALLMTVPEARNTAARWLAESQLARETIRFRLPPSQGALGPGDVISLARRGDRSAHRWRIDRVERAGAITVDAVRTEPGIYRPVDYQEGGISVPRYQPPMPVWPVIMDLPLMRGNEVPHAPHIAVAAKPWPGSVAVYGSSSEDSDFELNTTLPLGAMIGVTESPLYRAKPGLVDRGHGVLVRFGTGALSHATEAALLQGANLVAIGNGSPFGWEIFQFTRADVAAPRLWSLRDRLRGQFGTDAMIPDEWPSGSLVVVLDGSLKQLALDPVAVGQVRHWRIGPATRSPDDRSYRLRSTATRGAGLRPLSPCHLRLDGDRLSWIRRTRLSGDRWDLREVPLAEAREAYVIQVTVSGEVREFNASTPWLTLPADLLAHVGQGALSVSVAQISDEYGPGPFTTRSF